MSQHQLRDPNYERNTIINYVIRLRMLIKSYDLKQIIQMDETPPYFDMMDTKTIDFVGAKSIDLLNLGADKSRFPVVLSISGDGDLLKALVIFMF